MPMHARSSQGVARCFAARRRRQSFSRVTAREPRSRETQPRCCLMRGARLCTFMGSQGWPRESQSGAFISRARSRPRILRRVCPLRRRGGNQNVAELKLKVHVSRKLLPYCRRVYNIKIKVLYFNSRVKTENIRQCYQICILIMYVL